MAWAWLVQFLPIAKEIFSGVNKVVKGKQKRKDVQNSVYKSVAGLYEKQYSSINRDLTLISSYKPIVARIQAVDIVLRRWEFLAIFCEKNDLEKALETTVTEKNVDALLKLVKEVSEKMDKFSGKANISWDEGGVGLTVAISNLNEKLTDLKSDIKRKKGNRLERVVINTRQAQEETMEFFVFWDKLLKEFVESSEEAFKDFLKELSPLLKKQVETIGAEYPREDWSQIVTSTLSSVGEIASKLDEEE